MKKKMWAERVVTFEVLSRDLPGEAGKAMQRNLSR
jgi:hypothetical protein